MFKKYKNRDNSINKDRALHQLSFHLLLLPAVIFVIIFAYIPIFGNIMAFQRYSPVKGILGSDFIGMANFTRVFTMNNIGRIIYNTLFIAVSKIALGIIVPVTFALLLNEIKNRLFVRTVQTVIYLPYFLSWIILGGIIIDVLSPGTGIINAIIVLFGGEPIHFLAEKSMFQGVLITSDVWKNFGFGTIVYLAALAGVDQTLYEAAYVDGANHTQRIFNITLPSIVPIIILMSVISIGGILDAGFEQVFNLINPVVLDSGEIIDTLVYRIGIDQADFTSAAAVGLVKSLVGFVLMIFSYRLAYKMSGYRVF